MTVEVVVFEEEGGSVCGESVDRCDGLVVFEGRRGKEGGGGARRAMMA